MWIRILWREKIYLFRVGINDILTFSTKTTNGIAMKCKNCGVLGITLNLKAQIEFLDPNKFFEKIWNIKT